MQCQARFPIHFYHQTPRKSYEKEIDEFFSNEDLIRRIGGTNAIKPYKSFVEKCRYLFERVDWHLFNKDKINEVLNEFRATKYSIWYYYNTTYKVCLLVTLFFWEYIYIYIFNNRKRQYQI